MRLCVLQILVYPCLSCTELYSPVNWLFSLSWSWNHGPLITRRLSIKCFYYRRQEEYRKITKCTEETSKHRTWLKHDKWFFKKNAVKSISQVTSTIALMPRNLAMSPSSALMSRPRRCLSASMRSWQGNDEKDWLHMLCSYDQPCILSHRSWILLFTTWINDSIIKAGIDACFVALRATSLIFYSADFVTSKDQRLALQCSPGAHRALFCAWPVEKHEKDTGLPKQKVRHASRVHFWGRIQRV